MNKQNAAKILSECTKCLFTLHNDSQIHLSMGQAFGRWYFENVNFGFAGKSFLLLNISLCVFGVY